MSGETPLSSRSRPSGISWIQVGTLNSPPEIGKRMVMGLALPPPAGRAMRVEHDAFTGAAKNRRASTLLD